MLGDSLLIAPVLEEGQKRRSVYLPAGRWSSLWDEQIYFGPGKVEIECGLENIPVLVRQGSLLPMEEDNRLVIHLYAPEPDQCAQYRLYSDAGDGSPIPGENEFRLDQFKVNHNGDGLEIGWQNEGSYPFPYTQVELALHTFSLNQAWLDGKDLQIAQNRLMLPVPEGTGRTILIK